MSAEKFVNRHNGPRDHEIKHMLNKIGADSFDTLIDEVVPKTIRLKNSLNISEGISELEYMTRIKEIASKNKNYNSYIGLGYYPSILPPVIQRNILENPSWYTSYTPYQAEISQGRLEALLNYQTVVMELTGMDLANASLLDEGTAAAEAMILMFNKRSRTAKKNEANILFIDEDTFPQTLDVVKTRAIPLGIEVVVGNFEMFEFSDKVFGVLVQYPGSSGSLNNYSEFTQKAHDNECLVTVAADLLGLTILTPPGDWNADIVVGSSQRFGIPMGYGGPHAGYFACKDEFKRSIPGRIIGLSIDANGNQALRMALQTREQHIKRERATSNICTAQALLASMAGMYAVYHGSSGLKRIAKRIHGLAGFLSVQLIKLGFEQKNVNFFDTINIKLPDNIKSSDINKIALEKKMNFYYPDEESVWISIDETKCVKDIKEIISVFESVSGKSLSLPSEILIESFLDNMYVRKGKFLNEKVFNSYHSETEMMRYIKKLERKDISLTHSMIPLGSCTMKLNSAVSMFGLSWPEFGNIHPFVPVDQASGYHELINELGKDLCEITGYAAISFQPNSGAAGEYTGLMVIREYHISQGEGHRDVILIPASAHGTNPASAVMAGGKVVIVDCDDSGNINIDDLKIKAEENRDNLSAFMVTYPSTHGVFESDIVEMIDIIHNNGGQVYMDGANMNAQVGLSNPGIIGADVCHLNLHKTFGIPHGGGGPGAGPIGVASHLVEFLPSHPIIKTGGKNAMASVSSAPWGSASILTISHAYIKLLGAEGLTMATKVAILNANYLASSLNEYFGVLYTGDKGRVAHEMILDCRHFKKTCDIETADIARRLMDYGFHAPTLSFPVHETLMVEPTESESLQELDRFIETMMCIRHEISDIENGITDKVDNVLKNAPHTYEVVCDDKWVHPYGRQKAAFPLKWITYNKFWPAVGKIDNGYGDRNLFCSCATLEEYR